MMANRILTAGLLLAGILAGAARAEPCPPQTLGAAERTISIGGAPRLGLKTYPQTLDLNDHEVVLTFDDGPAATTPRVLEALAAECVHATFFLIGRNAAERPALVRQEIEAGHTVGSHSFSHPGGTLRNLPLEKALAEIDKGVAAVDKAAGGKESKFFRFPGFGDSPALLEALEKKNMPTFGTDFWASDWNDMKPQEELDLLMGRLRREGRGVILLHDTRQQTAEMMPLLLAKLKEENFHLVHIIPGDAPPAIRKAPDGWVSETEATLQHMGINGAPKRARKTGNKTEKKTAGRPQTAPAPEHVDAPVQEHMDAPAPEAKP